MNLFLAAVFTNHYKKGMKGYEAFTPVEAGIADTIPHVLESYHYVHRPQYVEAMRANGAQVFLDSGAFSAHTLGVSLDITAYCDYIKSNIDILRKEDGVVMASVLDGIGDPLKTWQNQLEMERQGAMPLPCFHFGEDTRYLDWYVERYPYITIGGMVGKTSAQLATWLDRIWERHLIDGAGRPKLKVHAFGITAVPIMERYPWFSVDSSSWVQSTAFGTIVHPKWGALSVSEKSPSIHDAGRHIFNLSKIEQQVVLDDLERRGFSYERLSTVYQSRAAFNMQGYRELNEQIDAGATGTFFNDKMELF
jgi:hypothetical protein